MGVCVCVGNQQQRYWSRSRQNECQTHKRCMTGAGSDASLNHFIVPNVMKRP